MVLKGLERLSLVLPVALIPLGCGSSDEGQSSTSAVLPIDSGYIRASAGPLYYEVRGEGHTVVLLHGASLDRRLWEPQFERLAESFRAVRYDIRPFGRSSPASRPYSDEGELLLLMDSLGIPTATLVGLSLGGRVAIDFALTYPHRVEQLVLVGPGLGGFEFTGLEERGARWEAAYERAGVEEVVEEWLRDPYMAPAMEHMDLAPTLRRIAQENGSAWLPSSHPYTTQPLNPPAIDRLGEIDAPTLVVVGARDVPDIHAISRLLDEEVPASMLVEIAGAGHIVNLEAPDEFDRVLLSFLARRSP